MTKTNPLSRSVSRSARLRWLAAAALAALPVIIASPAHAQNRVGSDGRANDANNRIGSSGINSQRAAPQIGTFGNDIVNGNVTGGREFRGAVPSSDFRAFQGGSSGARVDNFTKNSAGVGVANAPPPIPNKAEVYYGLSRETAPPPGFIQVPNGTGYVQAIVQPQRLSDTRLGNVNVVDAPPPTFFEKPTDLLVGGFDVATQQPGLLSASSLYGVRALNMSNNADVNFANRFANGRQDTPANRLKLDQRKLDDARNELQVNANENGAQQDPTNLARPLVQAFETPANGAVSEKPLNGALQSKPITGDVAVDTGTRQRVLAGPGQQSATYAELQKRLERYNTVKKGSAEEAARIFNEQMKAKKDAEAKAGKTGGPVTPGAPGTGNVGPVPATPLTADPIKNKTKDNATAANAAANKAAIDPLKVQSMVSGVTAKGLSELLKKAEDLMKDGKFTTAIDQYAAAEQVAPNQPLIWIGRANAELGASYYGRAEAHLKQAFNSDKALLMAQYDLRSFLGEDRMASVLKDLKEMATTNQQSPTPVFLLAYIAYNTGNERRAAGYLDLADKRSGGKDPIYQLLRDHWSLPADENKDTKPADLEKLNK